MSSKHKSPERNTRKSITPSPPKRKQGDNSFVNQQWRPLGKRDTKIPGIEELKKY